MQVLQGKSPTPITKSPPIEPQKIQEMPHAREPDKLPRGRVPATPTRTPTEADKRWGNKTKTTFPRPKGGVRTKDFKAIIRYWKSLTPDMLARCKTQWYRKWPVINPELAGAKTRTIAVYKDDPIAGTTAACPYDEENWKEQILHEFGSGDYKVILCEEGVSGAVAECDFVTVRDHMIPPRIDIRMLVMGDPLNVGYMQELRQRGVRLPGDPDFKDDRKEEDMAQAEALQAAIGANERLTERVITMAESKAHQPTQRSEDGALQSKGLDIYGQLLRTSQELQGKQVNPIEMLTTLGGVMKEIMPHKDGPDPMVGILLEQNATLQREMRDRDERRAKEDKEHREREEDRHSKAEERREREYKERLAAEKPKTLLEQLREKNEIDELLGFKKGKKSSGDDDEDEKKDSTLDTVLKYMPLAVSGITTLFTLGANMLYNARLKPGEVPQPVPTQSAAQVQAETMALASGQTVDQANAAKQQQEQLNAFLQSIEGPFLAHFFGIDLNGYSFAEHIINSSVQGSMIYAQMKSGGKDALLQALATYNPIWSKVGGMQPDLHKFADEFLNYQEWKQALDDEDDEEVVDTKAVN